ncbi:MAG TPA: glycosyltransferase family 2 protein [Acidimicrobiales bacterium]|nr:glycosyltransferase family 2 protein [Acidimicrobiales bacterium]
MTGAAPSTSVVIVSYQPGDWLRPCLESAAAQSDQVIVVDNGSPGSSATAIARSVGVTAVRSERNLGFSGGVNLGARSARGRVLALLNDDAVAGSEWMPAAVEALQDASLAAVGPKVVLTGWYREVVLPDPAWHAPGDTRPLGRQLHSVTAAGRDVLPGLTGSGIHRLEGAGPDRWRWTTGPEPFYVPLSDPADPVLIDGSAAPEGPVCRLVNTVGTYLRPDGYTGDIGIGSPDDGRFDRAEDRFGVSGAALAVRRDTWDRLGPLAGPFFAYYEDVDWCWRAQLAGLRVRYDPSVTVHHHRSATAGGSDTPRVRVLAESNRTLALVRNGPSPRALRHLRYRWGDGPAGGVRSRVARLLPWAVATRAANRRKWALSPQQVWDRWAGVSCEWDCSPARGR